MVPGDASRLRREDCNHTKHDRHFSPWEILIGPRDWEEHSLGKEGAERYRVHNLPKNSGSGVYELGISVSRAGSGRERGKLDPNRIVVVYLGEADNVRTRLQHYGRSGSHLGNSYSKDHKGPGLFEEVLFRGYPIVFRWANMPSKSEALKTEIQLLNTFDYAWNMSINGTRRPGDILEKLKKISSSATHFFDIARQFVSFSQKQVGVRIKTRDLSSANEETRNLFSRVFKFGRSQPKLVQDKNVSVQIGSTICGVVLGPDSVCKNAPVEGRKRCDEHRNMKVRGLTQPIKVKVNCSSSESFTPSCGFVLVDGSPCCETPLHGNRCQEHQHMLVKGLTHDPTYSQPVTVKVNCSTFESLIPCSEKLLHGNERCLEHMKVKGLTHDPKDFQTVSVKVNCSSSDSFTPLCGFILADLSPCCEKPLHGNKRCLEHKGRRVRKPNSVSVLQENPIYMPEKLEGQTSPNSSKGDKCNYTCGMIIGDGLLCEKLPVAGRVRCEEHKGMRVSKFASKFSLKNEF